MAGHKTAMASKHLLFLGTAAIAVGLTYLIIYLYRRYLVNWPSKWQSVLLAGVFLLLIYRLPFVYFIDDPVILTQIEKIWCGQLRV